MEDFIKEIGEINSGLETNYLERMKLEEDIRHVDAGLKPYFKEVSELRKKYNVENVLKEKEKYLNLIYTNELLRAKNYCKAILYTFHNIKTEDGSKNEAISFLESNGVECVYNNFEYILHFVEFMQKSDYDIDENNDFYLNAEDGDGYAEISFPSSILNDVCFIPKLIEILKEN